MSAISVIEPEAPSAPEPAPLPLPAPEPLIQERIVIEQPKGLIRILPIAAVSLAVLASFMAVVGLTIASRTVANASLVVADARERQAQLAQIAVLVEEVYGLRAREEAALKRMEQFRAGAPVTVADMDRVMEDLKRDLAKHEPEGGKLALVSAGQSELAERIGQIALKLERIEAAMKVERGRVVARHP